MSFFHNPRRPHVHAPSQVEPRKPGKILAIMGVVKPESLVFTKSDEAKAAKANLETIAIALERVARAEGRNSRSDAILRLDTIAPISAPDNLTREEAELAAELAKSWARQAGALVYKLNMDFSRRQDRKAPVVTKKNQEESAEEREKRLADQQAKELAAKEERRKRQLEIELRRQDPTFGACKIAPKAKKQESSGDNKKGKRK